LRLLAALLILSALALAALARLLALLAGLLLATAAWLATAALLALILLALVRIVHNRSCVRFVPDATPTAEPCRSSADILLSGIITPPHLSLTFLLWSGTELDWKQAMAQSTTAASSVRRRLQAIAAVLRDPAATEHEKANAATLEKRLQQKLLPKSERQALWPRLMFRLGRTVKVMRQSSASSASKGDLEEYAFRLGRALRQWRSDRM
jgi:hypothetical protein